MKRDKTNIKIYYYYHLIKQKETDDYERMKIYKLKGKFLKDNSENGYLDHDMFERHSKMPKGILLWHKRVFDTHKKALDFGVEFLIKVIKNNIKELNKIENKNNLIKKCIMELSGRTYFG